MANKSSSLLVITDSAGAVAALQAKPRSFQVSVSASFDAVPADGAPKDFVVVDIREIQRLAQELSENDEPDHSAAVRQLRRLQPGVPLIIMTPPDLIRDVVKALRAGADDYVHLPLTLNEMTVVLDSTAAAIRRKHELAYLRSAAWHDENAETAAAASPAMQSAIVKAQKVAPTKSTVLILGETGTGKGVLAQLIHRLSPRRTQPFISVHCGAIPDTLVESELFGHERGAFTGATRRKPGKFEIAGRGTIFLDEIATVPKSVQVKLLQVLQDRVIYRVGGEEPVPVDSRIIAATNDDLAAACVRGDFREDLFYRLNVFPILIPALRDRCDDIPELVRFFLNRLNSHYDRGIEGVEAAVIKALKNYSWPGNIRELENVIERAYILEDSSMLTADNFPPEVVECGDAAVVELDPQQTLAITRQQAVDHIEREYLSRVLTEHNGHIGRTAAAAGISERQLHKLMQKHSLDKRDFKRRTD